MELDSYLGNQRKNAYKIMYDTMGLKVVGPVKWWCQWW